MSTQISTVLRSHALWLAREPGGVRADLRSASLADAGLAGADLREADLSGADLRGADLREARLERAVLRFVDFTGAHLQRAKLDGAVLRSSSLEGADLTGACFAGSDLRAARLDGVRMSWFDAALVSERLWQAAGDHLEHRMLAAFVGRSRGWCWEQYRVLHPKLRLWVLRQFRAWMQPGDESPEFLRLDSAAWLDQP